MVEARRYTIPGMSRRLRRLTATWLLALLGFAQGSLAIAGCVMDRAELPQVLTGTAPHDCCDEAGGQAMSPNGCVTQSTSDLQVVGAPIVPAAVAPSLQAVLVVASLPPGVSARWAAEIQPPTVVPPRILLHSFLI